MLQHRVGEIVEELAAQKTGQKKDWALTESAFQRLLKWLDEGADSGGQGYLKMRQRLVAYFDRKNCHAPDELADETLNIVARRLEEEGNIVSDTPAHYCYIVARFVFLEHLRGAQREPVPIDELLRPPAVNPLADSERKDERARHEKLLECLERCTEKLEPQNSELIVGYYYGEHRAKIENRRRLAARLNITMNALSIRACRIRDKLEACVSECARAG